MKVRSTILALLIVLGGCTGAPTTTDTEAAAGPASAQPTQTETTPSPTQESDTSTPSPTETRTPYPTATPVPPEAVNPWGKAPVTVAINNTGSPDRNFRPHVKATLAFWEANAQNYTSFGIDYELVNSTSGADIVVKFTEKIWFCQLLQHDDSTVGCAPVYHGGSNPDDPTMVEIETGYSDESTVDTLKHEFGHTLGLTHEDNDTVPFMAEAGEMSTLPQPDLSEREYYWNTLNLKVYADTSVAADHTEDDIREDISRVVGKYNGYGHERLPENFSIEMVNNESEADITVKIVEETPSGDYSDGDFWGADPDDDGKIEYQTNATIYVEDAHHDEISFHVGYWMGWAIYANDADQLPDRYQPD